jgi:hypothetical protein
MAIRIVRARSARQAEIDPHPAVALSENALQERAFKRDPSSDFADFARNISILD